MTAEPGVAIVTGGASGIGFATVGILLDQGWRVVGLDRDPKAIATAQAAFANHGEAVKFNEIDVCDEHAIIRLVEQTEQELGPIKGLVTCAGIARDVAFLDTPADLFRTINEVNVIGTFIIARAVALAMRASGGGAIVTIASVSGLTGNIGRAAYGASKGAIVNLTRVMSVELAPYGIRVNSVAPGPIETPMVAAVHTAEIRDQWYKTVPMARYGNPPEIGEAIAFLLDRRASYITGQILAVDGGFTSSGLLSHQ